jgi:hypothetical protein
MRARLTHLMPLCCSRMRASVLLLAVVVGSSCAGQQARDAPQSAPSQMLGHPVELHLPNDSGQLVRVPQPGVRATVLDFWAPSCKPCRHKLPALVAHEPELRARGARLVLVGVLSDSEGTDEARHALASWVVRRRFLVDRGGVAQKSAGVLELPATLILDEAGVLRWVAPDDASAEAVVRAVP